MSHILRLLIAALLGLATFGSAQAAGHSDALQANIVRVDTSQAAQQYDVYLSVADGRGRPITGLTADAFTLSEDGAPMSIDSSAMVTDSQQAIAFALVMDVSGSMADDGKLDAAKQAARGLAASLGPVDSAAVISFGNQVNLVQGFTSDKDALAGAIDSLQAGGNTSLYDAVDQATLLADALPQPLKVVLVLTDGADTSSTTKLSEVTGALTNGHSLLYAVGLGSDADRPVLGQLAGAGDGQALYPNDLSELGATYQAVLNQLRLVYRLRYRSPATAPNQSHTVSAGVGYQGQQAQASSEYTAASTSIATDLVGVAPGEVVAGTRQVEATLRSGIAQRLDLLLDGQAMASSRGQPATLTGEIGSLPPGDHQIDVRVTDASGNVTDQQVPFSVAGLPTPEPTEVAATPGPDTDSGSLAQTGWLYWLVLGGVGLLVAIAALIVWAARKRRRVVVAAGGAPDDATLELAVDALPESVAVGEHHGSFVRVERDGQRQDVPLTEGPLTIGRGGDNIVVVPDGHVSRHHARIVAEGPDAFWLEDLNSQNGTLLNGQRLSERSRLSAGDEVGVGDATLTFFAEGLVAPVVAATEGHHVPGPLSVPSVSFETAAPGLSR